MQLTVVLIVLSILLVLAATLDQVNLGLLAVQEKYFRTFFVFARLPSTKIAVPMFPGGYLIGGLLLVNLIAAHIHRFRFSWKNSGLLLTHAGLILLLMDELLTGWWQRESSLQLREGETRRYSEDFHRNELVFINTSGPQSDTVVSIPEASVADRGAIKHPMLPFNVRVIDYMMNAALQAREQSPQAQTTTATAGVGPRVAVQRLAPTAKADERNAPAAFLELTGTSGSLGTWLVSTLVEQPPGRCISGLNRRIRMRSPSPMWKRGSTPCSRSIPAWCSSWSRCLRPCHPG